MTHHVLNLEELCWDNVKEEVWKANPELSAILEQFPTKHGFIKAKYLFGEKILDQGTIHLPTQNGETLPLDSPQVPESIRKKLEYSYVPLGLILSRSVEVYFETEDRVMPSKLFAAGSTFGLWEAFDPPPSDLIKKVWNLSAGARSIFLLPKISDNVGHNRLKRDYGILAYPPKKLLFQHNVFSDLARYIPSENKWYCDILFFSKEWLEEHEDDLNCLKLKKYWLQEAWRQSFNCRNQMSYDVAWEEFSREVTRRNWKPRPYIINTLKHLMAISEGTFPGFVSSGNSEIAAPIHLLQEAYMKTYMLKQYAPIIMHPHHLKNPDTPVYYSLYLPTLLEYAPQAKNPRSIMTDMREIKMLAEVLVASKRTQGVTYDFFHSEADRFSEIRSAIDMFQEDPHLSDYPKKYGSLKCALNSPFLRGCIRISLK